VDNTQQDSKAVGMNEGGKQVSNKWDDEYVFVLLVGFGIIVVALLIYAFTYGPFKPGTIANLAHTTTIASSTNNTYTPPSNPVALQNSILNNANSSASPPAMPH
jgi:hypothetical protein